MVMPVFISRVSSAALLDLGDQRDAMIAGARYAPHHPHHRAISDGPVAANIDQIVAVPPRASMIAFSFGNRSSSLISSFCRKI